MIRASNSQNYDNSPPSAEDRRQYGNAYGKTFWFCYVSNTCIMLAISLLFRYADFVTFYGGTEFHLGWIVGLGMVGSLVMRIWQADRIDRYGARIIWIGSLVLFICSLLGHLFISDVRSVPIFALRIIYQVSVAGMFGASITFISRTVPSNRMGEIIGVLGTSGFVGMAFGPWIGDLLFGDQAVSEIFIRKMFLYAIGLACVALVTAWLATLEQPKFASRKKPPLLWLLKRYNPGSVMLMGIAIGIGISIPGVFLRTYAISLDIHQLRIFFVTYAFFAFAIRMLTRRLPDQIGFRPMILLGMACLIASLFLYMTVQADFVTRILAQLNLSPAWGLVIPAVMAGTSHAFLFPSVVASCSARFPLRYRGLGTTLALAGFDLGALIGMPLVGEILSLANETELPAYPTMFIIMAALLSTMTLFYAFRSREGGNARLRDDAQETGEVREQVSTQAKPNEAKSGEICGSALNDN